jgi:hypothetical protein
MEGLLRKSGDSFFFMHDFIILHKIKMMHTGNNPGRTRKTQAAMYEGSTRLKSRSGDASRIQNPHNMYNRLWRYSS